MAQFYKISKANAELLTRFEYEKNKSFDPFVNEQKDGSYLVSEEMFTVLKEHANFKKIDFTQLSKITLNEIDSKAEQ